MTVTAIRRLSAAVSRDIVRKGEVTPRVQRQLRALFLSQWDRFDPKWTARKLTLWFDRQCYLELRRQLLLSGDRSLTAFLIRRLGLRGRPSGN